MKVLMLSTDKHAFTEGSSVRERFKEYGKQFEALHILVLHTGFGEAKEEISKNVTLYGTRSLFKAKMLFDAVSIGARIGAREKIDVVSSQDPFEVGEVAMRIAKKIGAKLHVQVHTDPTSKEFLKSAKNLARVGIMHRVLKKADAIRVVSERVKRGLKAKVLDIVEPNVLPIVQGLAPVSKEKGKPRFPFTILCVGRLEKEKHWVAAINVLVEAQKSFPGAGIVFVGEGSEKARIKGYAASKGLKDSVYFAGWSNDVHEWYFKAHCLLHTSAYEGYGRVLIEAALSHLPVVTTDVGVAGEVLRLGQDGFICPVDDVPCLAAGVRELMNNTYLRETMPRQAYDQAVAHIAKYKNFPELFKKDMERALS
ncbi:MAG: glycosyltransferase [Patescibacteria group bacterium UBA2103]